MGLLSFAVAGRRLAPPPSTRVRRRDAAALRHKEYRHEPRRKVAIVTGGNSGIGKAIVLELAKQGTNVVIDYVSQPRATEALERQVAALGDQAVGVDAGRQQGGDLQRLVDAAVQKFGRLDIMVNNAGVETRTSVLDTTEEQYDRVLHINLKSAFFGTQLAAKQMIKQGSGGRHHQHHVGPRRLAHAGQHRLLPVQGRHAHAHPHRRGRVGAARRPGRRRGADAVATPD